MLGIINSFRGRASRIAGAHARWWLGVILGWRSLRRDTERPGQNQWESSALDSKA
jgi:hypothetical protein